MKTRRTLLTLASLLTVQAANADLIMDLAANKTHYQVGPQTLRFEGGELDLFLRDGLVILDGACVIDPQLFFFGPSNIPPCPLGATGFVATGDVDRDGVRDDNQYWSVSSVIPAFVVEPSRPEIPQLYSGPPSKLPRPLQNFRDDAVVTFYDISTAVVRQYDQSRYELVRPYGSVRQVETALALGNVLADGSIDVIVTGSDIVGSPLTVSVPVLGPDDTPDPDFPGQTGPEWAAAVREALADIPAITDFYSVGGAGNLITLSEIVPNGNDATLNINLQPGTAVVVGLPSTVSLNTTIGAFNAPVAALKQMNEEIVPGQYIFTFPRLGSPDLNPVAIPVTIVPNLEAVNPAARTRAGFRYTSGTWNGDVYQMDPRLINKITWTGNDRTVIRPGDQFYFSILNDAEDFLLFPPTVPQNPVLLSIPTVQQYNLPPFFFDVGQTGVMNLRYQRNLLTNGVAGDFSQRRFRAKVSMVDSFNGFVQTTFPLGTTKRDLTPAGDVDKDGTPNIEEFAFQFPTNEDISASAREQFIPQARPPVFGVAVVEVFSRVITKVPNPIIDPEDQPAPPAAPFLDADNRVVFEVPVRPRTGNTLRYNFVQVPPNGKKGKKVKIGTDYTLETREVTSTTPVIIEVEIVTADTRETVGFATRATPDVVTLTQEILVLKSVDPVADPDAELPDLRVNLSAVTLK
jgi:hypothetical protein